MASGSEDFITPVVVSVSSTFTAIDELAARQKSADTFDRRGNVLYAHDMSEGLSPYLLNESGTGDSVTVDTTKSFYGSQSLLIAGGSVANDNTGFSKRHRLPSSQYIGLEALFMRDSSVEIVDFGIQYTKDGVQYTATVGLELASDELFFLDSALVRQELLSVDVSDFSVSWRTFIKLVIDIENHTYHRTIFEGTEIAHSQPLPNAGSNQPDFVSPRIFVRSDGTQPQEVNILSFVFTINEPGN